MMVISEHWTGQWHRQSSSLTRPNQHGTIFFQGFIPEMLCLCYIGEKQFNKVLWVVKSHRGNNEGLPTHQRSWPKAEMSCTFFFKSHGKSSSTKITLFFLLQSDSTKCFFFKKLHKITIAPVDCQPLRRCFSLEVWLQQGCISKPWWQFRTLSVQ